MVDAAPLFPDRDRPTHPLKAWREAQHLVDHGSKLTRAWTIADAARRYSAFIGRTVPYHTWRAWELYRGEPGYRIPNFDDMRGLKAFTQGVVTADHFYQLQEAGEPPPAAAAGG